MQLTVFSLRVKVGEVSWGFFGAFDTESCKTGDQIQRFDFLDINRFQLLKSSVFDKIVCVLYYERYIFVESDVSWRAPLLVLVDIICMWFAQYKKKLKAARVYRVFFEKVDSESFFQTKHIAATTTITSTTTTYYCCCCYCCHYYLTNREALTVLCSVIKHAGSG